MHVPAPLRGPNARTLRRRRAVHKIRATLKPAPAGWGLDPADVLTWVGPGRKSAESQEGLASLLACLQVAPGSPAAAAAKRMLRGMCKAEVKTREALAKFIYLNGPEWDYSAIYGQAHRLLLAYSFGGGLGDSALAQGDGSGGSGGGGSARQRPRRRRPPRDWRRWYG